MVVAQHLNGTFNERLELGVGNVIPMLKTTEDVREARDIILLVVGLPISFFVAVEATSIVMIKDLEVAV